MKIGFSKSCLIKGLDRFDDFVLITHRHYPLIQYSLSSPVEAGSRSEPNVFKLPGFYSIQFTRKNGEALTELF